MFSWYYMSLFLILIFFSFLFFFVLVFRRIVKSDDSVTEIIHIYLYKKQVKKNHREVYTGAPEATYMYHQVDWNSAHT